VSPLRIGVLGAGVIATAEYGVLPNMVHLAGKAEVTAIADIVPGRASAVAERFGIPSAYGSLADMLARADIDAVANLTQIPAHAETSLEILAAGRHLITEKPLATTMADADAIVAAARSASVLVVCAPPNMLYPSRREARRLVAAGEIGQVALGKVRTSHAGPAAMGWPTDPSWFYQQGSGPLFDIGVYGIHELTGILGPARRVTACTRPGHHGWNCSAGRARWSCITTSTRAAPIRRLSCTVPPPRDRTGAREGGPAFRFRGPRSGTSIWSGGPCSSSTWPTACARAVSPS
jgi:predicted dehydrogenase